MALIKGKCPICGQVGNIVLSNNPMVAPTCTKCIEKGFDMKSLENADFFCRTFNIPFHPTMWIKAIMKDDKHIIENYTQYFLDLNKDKMQYTTTTQDLWKEANREWERVLTHAELLENIVPIKEDFMSRGRVVWGVGFSFEEYIKMENQYQTTVSSFDVTNPMQMDAIRKACLTSVMIDRALTERDVKSLKDLSAAYSQFMKMAKIDELIESSQTDVIRTVADLANYLEGQGFEFKFYDNYERDIVDKTINNIKEHLRTLVLESTGLEATLEIISKKYQENIAAEGDVKALINMPLEELVRQAKQEIDIAIDEELQDEDILDEVDLNNGVDDDAYEEQDF